MILLTGVTGTCGKEVLRLLSAKKIPLRAMARNPDKVKAMSTAGLEIVQGDLENEASIENAMRDVNTAFMLMPNVEQQLACEKRFIDVAKRMQVAHIVKLSASGADTNSPALLKRYHGEAEAYLTRSGMAYTHIRPNFFMHNMLHCATTIAAEGKFYLPMGRGRTGAIDVLDVADVVVATLTENGHVGHTYYITGPELLSFNDLAEQMSAELARTINYVDMSADEFRKQLIHWGSSDWYVDTVSELFKLIAEDSVATVTDTYAKICGKLPRSFRQFVHDHAPEFSGS